jgi:hypothetical protein
MQDQTLGDDGRWLMNLGIRAAARTCRNKAAEIRDPFFLCIIHHTRLDWDAGMTVVAASSSIITAERTQRREVSLLQTGGGNDAQDGMTMQDDQSKVTPVRRGERRRHRHCNVSVLPRRSCRIEASCFTGY